MNEWYYSAEGQQRGPVSLDELRQRAASGRLDPARDLVWNATMQGWLPAGQVPGIFQAAGPGASAPFGSNPYAPPLSGPLSTIPADGRILEIAPGTQPLDPGACVSRAFSLTNRNYPNLLLCGIVYVVITFGLSFLLQLIQGIPLIPREEPSPPKIWALSTILGLLSNVISIFLNLGLTRIALNVASGDDISLSLLFSQGSKLLRAIGASLIFGCMIVLGFILLIVPGIYLGLRFGQFLPAIVDRNLGVIDSLKYSYQLTRNSALPLFLLWILNALIVLGGLLALGIGLLYAVPVVTVSMTIAYRFLQYGYPSLLDTQGTRIPALRGRTANPNANANEP